MDLDLLDHLGASMLLSNKLTFLCKLTQERKECTGRGKTCNTPKVILGRKYDKFKM